MTHVQWRLWNAQTIKAQVAFWRIAQKQQLTACKRMQDRQKDVFMLLPETRYQRPGIQLAVEGEKQSDVLRLRDRGEIDGVFSNPIGCRLLLRSRERAAQMPNMAADILSVT